MGDLDTLIVDVQKQLGAIIQKVGGRALLPQQLFLVWFLCSTSPPSVRGAAHGLDVRCARALQCVQGLTVLDLLAYVPTPAWVCSRSLQRRYSRSRRSASYMTLFQRSSASR
jgi:hypothetical protein